ncbi:paired amphipathic helix protein Sin3a-like [Microplitis mediator]|uniref:paired amphipathic helix protein Sin3a-like n=1 Tax=Microplitis mediator TaxID=375433 RepID=UPI0025540908|nr:paired amphipathic helix protein Sin3a-like [Microplitis mediator]
MVSNMQLRTAQQNIQRLNVEDAVLYLNKVRCTFSNQPQVYADFLNIMKDLKSRRIAISTVVSRVSNLFEGHPELIVGFNTYLPPGYKIEVHSNEQGLPFQVYVTTPSSTPTQTSIVSQNCTVNFGPPPVANPPSQLTNPPSRPTNPPSQHTNPSSQPINLSSRPINPSSQPTNPPSQPTNVPSFIDILQGLTNRYHTLVNNVSNNSSHITAAVSQAQNGVVQNSNSGQTQQNRPIDFNHAINFVNKIRNRFHNQPYKYTGFLEILHTYQRGRDNLMYGNHTAAGRCSGGGGVGPAGDHLTVAEVYSKVADLFENQEDLLAEFRGFLPSPIEQSSLGNQAAAVNSNNAGNIPRDHRYPGPERNGTGIRDMNSSQNIGQPRRSLSLHPSVLADHYHHAFHGPSPLHTAIIREMIEIIHLLAHL